MEVKNDQNSLDSTDLDNISVIELNDGYLVKIIPDGLNVDYIIKDTNNREVGKYKGTQPITITERSIIGVEIKKHLNPSNDYTKERVSREFEEVKGVLQESYEIILNRLNEELERVKKEKERILEEKKTEAKFLLESEDLPLIRIASLVSWLTAGERNNIMLTFIAYCSQVILDSPISVIGLGEGSSGKTHIQEVAMSLLPDEFVLHEKGSTGATTFNRAKDDPNYYDGKIVNFGDLGGKNSQDFVMEAKNLLKELQSDGFVNKPLNIPTKDEGWVVIDLTLYGKPCLTYTTVPGFKFDDQEMSRSIFITPRTDNRAVFNARKQILELKHGRTYNMFKKYESIAKDIQYVIYLLKERMEELTIINPYTKSVIDFLGESEYFKRDFDKYNGILKTITAFHSFNRPTFDIEGEEILFTSLNDIQLFISLLRSYHEAISVNVSPKAAEILSDLRERIDEWILAKKISELGITTNEYFELSGTTLSKRSVQRYFSELNNAGFLKTVRKEGSAWIYALSEKVGADILNNLLILDETEQELIKWELGDSALHFIKEDVAMDGLDIKLQDKNIPVPGWERYDN